jgi:exopolyphosphatase / guanosine-5'-triphosphate,3'-diphosphate pyrophosphatase
MPEIFASVDIGSNAVRLLFSNVYTNTRDEVITEKATLLRIPVRLGMDVFETGKISPYRQGLLVKTLQAFRLLIDVYNPAGYRICATSAMREAENRQMVLDAIQHETGFDVEVIDGREEARLISSCNNFGLKPGTEYQLYIDVGGGSTELSLFQQKSFVASTSINIGTIRLLNDKVNEATWDEMKQWIKTHVPRKEKLLCIGSGGNINKLVKLFGNPQESSIMRKRLKVAHQHLASLPMDIRSEQYGMRQDRADVIVPAAEIFLRIMKWGAISKVTAPRFGLADGLAIAQYNAYQNNKHNITSQ